MPHLPQTVRLDHQKLKPGVGGVGLCLFSLLLGDSAAWVHFSPFSSATARVFVNIPQ